MSGSAYLWVFQLELVAFFEVTLNGNPSLNTILYYWKFTFIRLWLNIYYWFVGLLVIVNPDLFSQNTSMLINPSIYPPFILPFLFPFLPLLCGFTFMSKEQLSNKTKWNQRERLTNAPSFWLTVFIHDGHFFQTGFNFATFFWSVAGVVQ